MPTRKARGPGGIPSGGQEEGTQTWGLHASNAPGATAGPPASAVISDYIGGSSSAGATKHAAPRKESPRRGLTTTPCREKRKRDGEDGASERTSETAPLQDDKESARGSHEAGWNETKREDEATEE